MKRYFIIRSAKALKRLNEKYPNGIAHRSPFSWYLGLHKTYPVFEVRGDSVLSWCYEGYYTKVKGVREEVFVDFLDYINESRLQD